MEACFPCADTENIIPDVTLGVPNERWFRHEGSSSVNRLMSSSLEWVRSLDTGFDTSEHVSIERSILGDNITKRTCYGKNGPEYTGLSWIVNYNRNLHLHDEYVYACMYV